MLTKECNERNLDKGLIQHTTHILLELGAGFADIGLKVFVLASCWRIH